MRFDHFEAKWIESEPVRAMKHFHYSTKCNLVALKVNFDRRTIASSGTVNDGGPTMRF